MGGGGSTWIRWPNIHTCTEHPTYSMITQQYGEHERQKVAIYSDPHTSASRWIVFIHGGAWRDPRNTFADCEALFTRLKQHGSPALGTLGLASIEYRLSPEVRHPAHICDVKCALAYLGKHHGAREVILIGHSAGTFLALQTLNFARASGGYEQLATPDPSLSLPQCNMVMCVEGIYDLPELTGQYPGYTDFVETAFGPDKHTWETASPLRYLDDGPHSDTSQVPGSNVFQGTIVMVHSPQDELLDARQHEFAQKMLSQYNMHRSGASVQVQTVQVPGKHDDVYRTKEFAAVVAEHVLRYLQSEQRLD